MRRQPGPLIPPAVSFADSSVSVPAEPAQSPTDSPDEAKRRRSLGGQSGFLARIAVCRTRSTHTRADTCLTSEAMCFCVRPVIYYAALSDNLAKAEQEGDAKSGDAFLE